jgi:hypothetical protein
MSIYKNVEGVKQDLLAKNQIFIPKKKEEDPKPNKLQPMGRGVARPGGFNRQNSGAPQMQH